MKSDEEVAEAAVDFFIEGMATDVMRGHFMFIIQNALCDYRDHILNSVTDEEDIIIDDPRQSANLLEGQSDSYVYAEKIIEALVESCIELQEER